MYNFSLLDAFFPLCISRITNAHFSSKLINETAFSYKFRTVATQIRNIYLQYQQYCSTYSSLCYVLICLYFIFRRLGPDRGGFRDRFLGPGMRDPYPPPPPPAFLRDRLLADPSFGKPKVKIDLFMQYCLNFKVY